MTSVDMSTFSDESRPIQNADQVHQGGVSALDLLLMLSRRKWLIIGVTFAVSFLTLAVLLMSRFLPVDSPLNLLPSKYRPTVKILFQDTSSGTTLSSLMSQSGISALSGLFGLSAGKTNSSDLAIALLKSDTMEDAIASEFDFVSRYKLAVRPRTEARNIIRGSLETSYDLSSQILTVGYRSTDAELATNIVNRMAELLQDRFRQLTLERTQAKKSYLEESIAAAEKDAADKTSQLIAFQTRYGIYDLNTQSQSSISSLLALQRDLTAKQAELQLQQKYLPDSDPQIVRLKDDIAVTENLISAMKAGGGKDFTIGMVPQKDMPVRAAEYFELQRNLEISQSILTVLRQQYETAKLEELDNSMAFQIIERAEVPEVRAWPNRTRIAMVAGFSAFVAGILLAFVVEYFQRARQNPVEMRKLAAIRTQFSIPRRGRRR